MIIFKNLSKAPKDNFPRGMIVEGTKGGTTKRTLMKDSYAEELWKRRPGSFFEQVRSLVINLSKGCLARVFFSRFVRSMKLHELGRGFLQSGLRNG